MSYPLSTKIPVYGGGRPPELAHERCMDKGDSCNTLNLTISNHAGTHVDCPSHFDPEGKTLTDYPLSHWRCHQIQVIPVSLGSAEICTVQYLQNAYDNNKINNQAAEAVFLLTGWHQKRDDRIYWESPPGFAPEIAPWLRKIFPSIRFFGFDLISLSSFKHRDLGRQAHRAFLCHEHPIMIVEDMNLAPLSSGFSCKNLLISPLMIEGADGAPCTVWVDADSNGFAS